MIQTRSDRATAHRHARRVNKVAGLATEFLRKCFKTGFDFLDIPIVDVGEFAAQREQSFRSFRFPKNFLDCHRIELVILGEKVASPLRHIAEKFDFLLHDREHGAEISSVGDVDLCFLQEWPGEFNKTIERHLSDVLAVEPKTFVEIEGSVAPIDFLQLEKFYHFFDVDLFAIVLRGPTEQAKIIPHRFGRITLLDVSGDARAFIALAHLRAVPVQDQRNVGKVRRRGAERTIKLDVLRCIGKMIFAADNMGNFHLDVVDHVHEMENPRAVGSPDRHIGMRPRISEIEVDLAADNIVYHDVLARRTKP